MWGTYSHGEAESTDLHGIQRSVGNVCCHFPRSSWAHLREVSLVDSYLVNCACHAMIGLCGSPQRLTLTALCEGLLLQEPLPGKVYLTNASRSVIYVAVRRDDNQLPIDQMFSVRWPAWHSVFLFFETCICLNCHALDTKRNWSAVTDSVLSAELHALCT